jgi:hypothetical protein
LAPLVPRLIADLVEAVASDNLVGAVLDDSPDVFRNRLSAGRKH